MERGGGALIQKMWIKVMFFIPSLTKSIYNKNVEKETWLVFYFLIQPRANFTGLCPLSLFNLANQGDTKPHTFIDLKFVSKSGEVWIKIKPCCLTLQNKLLQTASSLCIFPKISSCGRQSNEDLPPQQTGNHIRQLPWDKSSAEL